MPCSGGVHELRNENAHQMLLHSFAAVQTARQMTDYPDADQADFQARALTEHANALRVCDRLHEAGLQLDLAEQWYAAGAQNPQPGDPASHGMAQLLFGLILCATLPAEVAILSHFPPPWDGVYTRAKTQLQL